MVQNNWELYPRASLGPYGREKIEHTLPPKAKIWEQRCYGVPTLAEWALGGQV